MNKNRIKNIKTIHFTAFGSNGVVELHILSIYLEVSWHSLLLSIGHFYTYKNNLKEKI